MTMRERTFSVGDLTEYATRLLAAGGYGPADAAATAELLVWANLRGAESHGVLRIPRYVEMVGLGLTVPGAEPRIVHEGGATRLVDAGLAPAARTMANVADGAVDIAERLGIGLSVVRRTSHTGAIGYFAQRMTARGMIGIVMSASKPLMAYPSAKGEALSSNPIAIGAPRAAGEPPILVDMSTAAVALGKVLAARDAGRDIPSGWGVDAEGRDTHDPNAVAALLPMAGPKGAGLSLMIEVLCSVLSGNPIIASALSGEAPDGFNALALAIDPGFFGDRRTFLTETSRLATAISALEPAEGISAVSVPGDRGRRTEIDRRANGIPLAAGTVANLARLAERLGVA